MLDIFTPRPRHIINLRTMEYIMYSAQCIWPWINSLPITISLPIKLRLGQKHFVLWNLSKWQLPGFLESLLICSETSQKPFVHYMICTISGKFLANIQINCMQYLIEFPRLWNWECFPSFVDTVRRGKNVQTWRLSYLFS